MKSIKVIIVASLGLFFVSIGLGSFIEKLPDNELYLFIHHDEVRQELQSQCTATDIQRAQQTTISVEKAIAAKLATMNQAEQFVYSLDLYRRISAVYSSLFLSDQGQSCYYSYILVSLQEVLREEHMAIIEQNGLLGDFSNVEGSDPFAGFQFKKELMAYYTAQYQNRRAQLPTTLIIREPTIDTQDTREQELAGDLVTLVTNMIYGTILDLYQKDFINKEEVEDIIRHIELDYKPANCGAYVGRFSVEYQVVDGQKINPSIDQIDLSINGCFNIFTLGELEEVITTLTLHEIGGHMAHYIKDSTRQEFRDICRNENNERKASCTEKDFVSTYSLTHPYEDYAEVFAYWWQEKLAKDTPVLQAKATYMDNLLKRIQSENR